MRPFAHLEEFSVEAMTLWKRDFVNSQLYANKKSWKISRKDGSFLEPMAIFYRGIFLQTSLKHVFFAIQ